ncbi:hypothetical protein Q3G72_007678 [Acer saccharum]|nr:hypothetical protein Q3G72_007678 [Acer saccharum]
MEPVDVKADLQALRKLYGLLQSSGDIAQKSKNEIFVGKRLDERARLMLKNLLDVATEKALETHSKIIAAAESRGVSNSGCYFKSKQSNVIPKLGSPALPYVFKSSPIAAGQRNSNSYNLTCRKDELSSSKPIPREVTLESSKASISSNRKKRCRVCQQQRSVEPQSNVTTQGNGIRVNGSVKEKGTESVKSNIASLKQKKIYEFDRNPSVCSSSSLATVQNKNKPEVVRNSDFSREITNSIRRIDSGISSLLVKPSEESNVSSPRVAKNSRLVTQFPARNVKAMDIETPPPPATSQHVPPSNAYVAKQPPRPRPRPLNHMAHQKVVKSRPLMQPHQVVKSRPLMPPRQAIVRPTLIGADKSETTRMRSTRVGPRQQESEETWSSPSSSASSSASPSPSLSSSASASSSWTNEQSSTYSSDTDEPMSFPASSPRGLRSRGNAMYAHRAGDSSSSVLDQSNSSSSHYRSYHHQNPDKAIGRLRRIKNKLGLIFHHHHHHHHHHYDHQGNDDDSDHHSKVSRTKHSTWKNLQNIFHHKNRNQKDDKLRKLTTHENQVKHFNTLVGGLRRQVRHSKKSKLKPASKEGIGRLRNGGKKVQWWKILKRHGGVKVGKKGRVKLGIQSRKSIKHLERR